MSSVLGILSGRNFSPQQNMTQMRISHHNSSRSDAINKPTFIQAFVGLIDIVLHNQAVAHLSHPVSSFLAARSTKGAVLLIFDKCHVFRWPFCFRLFFWPPLFWCQINNPLLLFAIGLLLLPPSTSKQNGGWIDHCRIVCQHYHQAYHRPAAVTRSRYVVRNYSYSPWWQSTMLILPGGNRWFRELPPLVNRYFILLYAVAQKRTAPFQFLVFGFQ
jgi:hypothetical protein